MKGRPAFVLSSVVWVSLALSSAGCGRNTAEAASSGLPPEKVADLIHTVVQADRTVYADQVVQRLQNVEGVIKATEHFEIEKTLPLPAQMLRMGAQKASESGELRYSLISLWAINKANAPKTDVERAGLEAVAREPDQPYRAYQTVNGKRYFVGVYADQAVSPACVKCHNEHPESPRRDFTPGDVMGAVVITLPLS